MEEQYLRNLPALSSSEQELLKHKQVLIAGCGGLGGYLLELLLRLGIGNIAAADGDMFETTNLNRQLLCQISLIGTEKAAAAAARAAAINPNVQFRSIPSRLTSENLPVLLQNCDAVLDALDSVADRRILAEACSNAQVPLIHGAVSGWIAQAAVSLPGDHLIDRIYPSVPMPNDKSVLSFTPALCASLQVSLCVQLLCSRPVETGTLYCFDLLHMELETIPLTERTNLP